MIMCSQSETVEMLLFAAPQEQAKSSIMADAVGAQLRVIVHEQHPVDLRMP